MKMLLSRRYIFSSLFLHVLVIVVGALLARNSTIRQTFIVFGAHSKKNTQTLFKTFKHVTPFIPARLKKKPAVVKRNHAKKVLVKKSPVKKRVEKKVAPKKMVHKKAVPEKKVLSQQKTKVPEVKKTEKKSAVIEPEKAQEVKAKLAPVVQEEKVVEKKSAKKIVQKKIKKTLQKVDPLKEFFDDGPSSQTALKQDVLPDDVQNLRDQEHIKFQLCIREEVDRRWRPPVGVTKGTECTLRFAVGRFGGVAEVSVFKKSGILIFDLSALRAARSCRFDKCLWGKTFQVDFRQ